MDDTHALHNNACRLPVEVCEKVIDMLYSEGQRDQVEHSRTLHSCSLVCRAWRTRSQRNLFYSVVLCATEAVYKLAAVLDNGPHLRDYVREVLLVAHTLHTTTNSLSLFPIVLHGKLPNLRLFTIQHVAASNKWSPRTSDSETTKPLEHVPLHPRFPLFLSAFTAITRLQLLRVTFRHFNDFLAMINALPALRDLICNSMRCMTLGPLPMYAKPHTDVGRPRARPFARKLLQLGLVCHLQCMQYQYVTHAVQIRVDVRCMKALVSACGPRLGGLSISMPYTLDKRMAISSARTSFLQRL